MYFGDLNRPKFLLKSIILNYSYTMQEPTITNNIRSYFERPLSTNQKRIHSSAEEERDWALRVRQECRVCKLNLPRAYFGYNTSGSWPFDRDGCLLRRPECLECMRIANSTKRMAVADAKERGLPTKAPPGTPCALCGKTTDIVFDHSHRHGKFRGWLCNSCNRAMGVMGDEPEELVKALMYSCGGNREEFKSVVVNHLKSLD